MTGRAILLGDNISGDLIIGGGRLAGGKSEEECVPYLFETVRPDFQEVYRRGDILAAGWNFGCGSSREMIIQVMKAAGIRCVIAKSFARQFYRGGINNGIVPVEADIDVRDGDEISVDMEKNTISVNGEVRIGYKPFPEQVLGLIKEGGILPYYKAHGGL